MIAMLRQMIFCITAAALFGAAVQALTKDGAIKEVIQMAVGILLILSLMIPLRRTFRLPELISLPKHTEIQSDAQELYTQEVLKQFQTEMQTYIQELMEKQGCNGTVSAEAYIDADDEIAVKQITICLKQGDAQAVKRAVLDALELDEDTVVITQ